MVRKAILEELKFNIILFSNWECSVLYCFSIQLHYTTLHYTPQKCTPLYYALQLCTALRHYCTALHYTSIYGSALHCFTIALNSQQSQSQRCTAVNQYCTVLHLMSRVESKPCIHMFLVTGHPLTCQAPTVYSAVDCSAMQWVQCSVVQCSAV